MAANIARPYDLVVYGASGFTGRLAAEYLARRYTPGSSSAAAAGEPVRWAMAGRDRVKLERVRDEMVAKHPHAAGKIDVLVGAIDDPAALEAVTSKTNAILSFAGPFALYGMPVVDACVKTATHYADITGEPTFIRDVIDKHDAAAKASKTCVVNCVGYDSVPWDLGAWAVAKFLKERNGVTCVEAYGHAGDAKGGVSGGTIASALHLMSSTSTSVMRKMASPHFLTRVDTSRDLDADAQRRWATQATPKFDEDLKRWTMPSVMAGINTKVVARSAELEPETFDARLFAYNESDACSSRFGAFVGTAALGLFGALLVFPPTRWALARFALPKPGEGPSESLRENGFANVYVVGTGASNDGDASSATHKAVAHFSFRNADPGYKGTAALAVEAALCLALPAEREKTPGSSRGGVLTPAAALGSTLVDRIDRCDVLGFDVKTLEETDFVMQ